MAVEYNIKLTPSTPDIMRFKGRDTFRLVVVASDAVNMPNEIFGHQRKLVDPDTNELQDEFCFVCSPYDLSAYPANAPDPLQSPQFYRLDTLDILLPSVTTYDEVWTSIQNQVAVLISTMKSLDRLNVNTPVWIPEEPASSSSSSSSSIIP